MLFSKIEQLTTENINWKKTCTLLRDKLRMVYVKHYPSNPKDITTKNVKRVLNIIEIYKKEKFPEYKLLYPSKLIVLLNSFLS